MSRCPPLFDMPPRLETFSRPEFLEHRWRHRTGPDGEHITICGPTGCGKTWLAWQLLDRSATENNPAVVLVKKPKDALIVSRGKAMGYKTVQSWPPPPEFLGKPPGWLVWPKTSFDPDVDHPHKALVFRKALLDSYKRGKRIVYADDAYGLAEILGLKKILIEMWTEYRSMGGSVLSAFQRPAYVPRWAYSQAEHIFLFNEPDKRSRDSFAEIGGIDPDLVRDTVQQLGEHQCLYIRRTGGRACIIDA